MLSTKNYFQGKSPVSEVLGQPGIPCVKGPTLADSYERTARARTNIKRSIESSLLALLQLNQIFSIFISSLKSKFKISPSRRTYKQNFRFR